MEITPNKNNSLEKHKFLSCFSKHKTPCTPSSCQSQSPINDDNCSDRFIRTKACHPLFAEPFEYKSENANPNTSSQGTKEEMQKYSEVLETQLFGNIDFAKFKAPSYKIESSVSLKKDLGNSCTNSISLKPIAPLIKATKVLDAPKIVKEIYFNVFHYCKGLIALALSNEVYYMDMMNSKNGIIISNEDENEVFSSVNWNNRGHLLAVTTVCGKTDIIERTEYEYKVSTSIPKEDNKLYTSAWMNNILLTGGEDGIMKGYDAKSGKRIFQQKMHSYYLWNIKCNEESSYIATGGGDSTVKLWDIRKSAISHTLPHNSNVKAICWNPKRSIYLSTGGGNDDPYIKTWNIVSSECVSATPTSAPITHLQWSTLSDDIISMHIGKDNNILVWNKSKLLSILEGHIDSVYCGYLGESGEQLYSIGGEGTLRIWNIYKKKKSKKVVEDPMKILIR